MPGFVPVPTENVALPTETVALYNAQITFPSELFVKRIGWNRAQAIVCSQLLPHWSIWSCPNWSPARALLEIAAPVDFPYERRRPLISHEAEYPDGAAKLEEEVVEDVVEETLGVGLEVVVLVVEEFGPGEELVPAELLEAFEVEVAVEVILEIED